MKAFIIELMCLPIHVPSLAERRSDIRDLISFFNISHAEQQRSAPLQFSEPALMILENSNWEGNIAALENFIARLYLRETGNLPETITEEVVNRFLPANVKLIEDDYQLTALFLQPLRLAKENFQKYYLQYQLQRYGGNISQIARAIEFDRASLHRKMKDLDINADKILEK